MTDTVNVPREAVVAALKEADRPFRQALSDYRYQILAEAALAAAPKAEPVIDGAHDQGRFARLGLTSENILDKMSEAATEIAGWGAGNEAAVMRFAMGEIARLSAQPEAPKVEQELLPAFVSLEAVAEAWSDRPEIREMITTSTGVFEQWANPELMSRFRQNIMGIVQQAFMEGAMTRTAPSDELLEALAPFARYYDLNDCHERRPDDALEVPISDLARAADLIAKHKGPQS